MVNHATAPSTVDGIKRLAKAIKREQELPHQKALDEAARKAGFQNFVHAKRELSEAKAMGYPVYITAYWSDGETVPRTSGRETIEVALPRPLEGLLTRHQIGRCRNLAGFKLDSTDHLECKRNKSSKDEAHHSLRLAHATLRFLSATGLVPASSMAHIKKMEIANELPGHDHMSWWIDPQSNDWIVLDEPYDPFEPRVSGSRAEYLQLHGLYFAQPNWAGLYRPGDCTPYLITPSENLLAKVKSKVETLESGSPAKDKLISDHYYSQFISPARVASGKARRARTQPSYGEHNGAVPYGGEPGIPSKWRPARVMPLTKHMSLGPMLRKLYSSNSSITGFKMRIYDKISSVRSLLDDWVSMEHGGAITREVDHQLYYGNPVEGYSSPDAALDAIEVVRKELLSSYGECKPLREILIKLEAASKCIEQKLNTESSVTG